MSLPLIAHARVVRGLQTVDCLALFLEQEIPFHCFANGAMHWHRKLSRRLDTTWKQPWRFQGDGVHFHSSRCQWLNDPFPFEIVLSHLHRLRWLCVLMNESENSWIVIFIGRWGWHPSILVFVFSSIVASVSNGSDRAAIFGRHFGCLNVEKWVHN